MAHVIKDFSEQETENNLTLADFIILSKEGPEDDVEIVEGVRKAILRASTELQDFISRVAKVNAFIVIAVGETEEDAEDAEGHSRNAVLQASFGSCLATHTLLRYLVKCNSETSEVPITELESRYNYLEAKINEAIMELENGN